MTLYRYYLVTLLALLTYPSSSQLVAAEFDIISIHDGRPYIFNITAGTFLQDAHRSLSASGFKQISSKDVVTVYRNAELQIELEINSNTKKRIRKLSYRNNSKFTRDEISLRGKEFGNLSQVNIVCRAALPYSMDCSYRINNEQGKYKLIGIFQQGGIQYILEGTPKFTAVTGFQSIFKKNK